MGAERPFDRCRLSAANSGNHRPDDRIIPEVLLCAGRRSAAGHLTGHHAPTIQKYENRVQVQVAGKWQLPAKNAAKPYRGSISNSREARRSASADPSRVLNLKCDNARRHARYFSDLLHYDVHLTRVDRAARRADNVRAARSSQRSADALVRMPAADERLNRLSYQERAQLRDAMTCPCVFPPDGVRVRPEEGRTDEASKVHGRADYRGVEGA